MYLDIEDLKKKAPQTMTVENFAKSLRPDEPTVVLRNYNEPTSAPWQQAGVEIIDVEKAGSPRLPYGLRPNVPGINVYNAIKKALGPGGYQVFMSDGSYTGYGILELSEYLVNFDSTNLEVWTEEIFDCDDFAQAVQGSTNRFFKGIPLGTLWYGDKAGTWGHAVNIFYSYEKDKVYLIEPQNDVFYEFDQKNWVAWVVML